MLRNKSSKLKAGRLLPCLDSYELHAGFKVQSEATKWFRFYITTLNAQAGTQVVDFADYYSPE